MKISFHCVSLRDDMLSSLLQLWPGFPRSIFHEGGLYCVVQWLQSFLPVLLLIVGLWMWQGHQSAGSCLPQSRQSTHALDWVYAGWGRIHLLYWLSFCVLFHPLPSPTLIMSHTFGEHLPPFLPENAIRQSQSHQGETPVAHTFMTINHHSAGGDASVGNALVAMRTCMWNLSIGGGAEATGSLVLTH